MRGVRACSVLFLAAALAGCSESVQVGDGREVASWGANKDFASSLQGEWQGELKDPIGGTLLPMLLTLREGPEPRTLYFKLRCASTDVCPITEAAAFASFFGAPAEPDAGLVAGELPEIQLELLDVPEDGSVRPNAVLRVNDWLWLPLAVSLNADYSVMHLRGLDDVSADFTRLRGPLPDGGSASERSSE